MTLSMPDVSVVIPAYRSEPTIGRLLDGLAEHLATEALQIVVVVDGCTDGTERAVRTAAARLSPSVQLDLVVLTRNFGEHAAVLSGLSIAEGGIVITMDDDLQHRPEDARRLLHELRRAPDLDVVYGQFPIKRHSWFRNVGSRTIDRLVSSATGKPREVRITTFRALRHDTARRISDIGGPAPYIDGLLLQMTDRIEGVPVEHRERDTGHSGYSLRRLVGLAGTIVTGLSVLPLRISLLLGAASAIVGLLAALAGFIEWLTVGTAGGWLSLFAAITVSGGFTLVALGVLGEYLGRVLVVVSGRRPFYVRRHDRFPDGPIDG